MAVDYEDDLTIVCLHSLLVAARAMEATATAITVEASAAERSLALQQIRDAAWLVAELLTDLVRSANSVTVATLDALREHLAPDTRARKTAEFP